MTGKAGSGIGMDAFVEAEIVQPLKNMCQVWKDKYMYSYCKNDPYLPPPKFFTVLYKRVVWIFSGSDPFMFYGMGSIYSKRRI